MNNIIGISFINENIGDLSFNKDTFEFINLNGKLIDKENIDFYVKDNFNNDLSSFSNVQKFEHSHVSLITNKLEKIKKIILKFDREEIFKIDDFKIKFIYSENLKDINTNLNTNYSYKIVHDKVIINNNLYTDDNLNMNSNHKINSLRVWTDFVDEIDELDGYESYYPKLELPTFDNR